MDSVILFWEGMEWAQTFGLDSLFIKIEFEKAYYYITWPFILAMLKSIWFGIYFLTNVETLSVEALTYLSINYYK